MFAAYETVYPTGGAEESTAYVEEAKRNWVEWGRASDFWSGYAANWGISSGAMWRPDALSFVYQVVPEGIEVRIADPIGELAGEDVIAAVGAIFGFSDEAIETATNTWEISTWPDSPVSDTGPLPPPGFPEPADSDRLDRIPVGPGQAPAELSQSIVPALVAGAAVLLTAGAVAIILWRR